MWRFLIKWHNLAQAQAFYIINPALSRRSISRWFDDLIVWLIMLNLIVIILESFQELEMYEIFFRYFEWFSVSVFSLEYLLHLWTANLRYPNANFVVARLRYIFSFMGLVDLISILPFYLPYFFNIDLRVLRVLRLVRLLRIFKLNRYSPSLIMFSQIVREKRDELGITIFLTFILLLVASTLMYHLESHVQPEQFPNVGATFWWAVATLTTVGYGDVYPVTNWGRFLSGCIALLGIGIVALPTSILSASYLEKLAEQRREKNTSEHNLTREQELERELTELRTAVAQYEAKTGVAITEFKGFKSIPNPSTPEVVVSTPVFSFCPYCGKKLPSADG
jgi:voltage-gated potassium channel